MNHKRKVEIFSGGCALCEEVIDLVRREAGSSSQITIHNMRDARALARAAELGIRSVPAVVIDGKLASNAGGGVDIEALKSELGRAP
jgi:glutaredoxin 3